MDMGCLGNCCWLLIARAGRQVEHAGVSIVDLGESERDKACGKIVGALELIGRHSALASSRIRRDLQRILLFDRSSPGFLTFLNAMLIGKQELDAASLEQIALVLVHESTHARLHRLGITSSRFGETRIERVCLAREEAFARRLPNGEAWIRFVRAKAATVWWSDDKKAVRKRRALQREGVSGFIIRAIEAFDRRRVGDKK